MSEFQYNSGKFTLIQGGLSTTYQLKKCNKCNRQKPLTQDYWYRISPRKGHKNAGWQSHCKECWKTINRLNKERRKHTRYKV